MRECDFAYPKHAAEYVVAEDGQEWATCEKHLADLIHWRFVNSAERLAVTKLAPVPANA